MWKFPLLHVQLHWTAHYRLIRQSPGKAFKYRIEYRVQDDKNWRKFVDYASTKVGARWVAYRHWRKVRQGQKEERVVNW